MIFSRMVMASAALGLLVACSEETAETGDAPDTAQINIQNADEQKSADIEKLHILEKYCVEYEHTGAMPVRHVEGMHSQVGYGANPMGQYED